MNKISLGNDISKYQGDVNFDVYKSNTNFLIIKATEGVGYRDPKFTRNQDEARRVGIPLGYYHFARPDLGNTAVGEADYFLGIIGELKEGEFLALDYECPNQVANHVSWCRQFLQRIYDHTGVKPFIYLNQSQIKTFDWQEVINGGFALWIAAYTYDPYNNAYNIGEFPSAAIQQWTNKQEVPGIPAVADGNVFFGDLDQLKKYGYKTPENGNTTNPPTNDDKIKQLEATIATLTTRAEKAELSVQTITVENTSLTEKIKQKDDEIKQIKDNCSTEVSKAVTTALEKQGTELAPYIYYNKSAGDLIGLGVAKLLGKDIKPKKGGEI